MNRLVGGKFGTARNVPISIIRQELLDNTRCHLCLIKFRLDKKTGLTKNSRGKRNINRKVYLRENLLNKKIAADLLSRHHNIFLDESEDQHRFTNSDFFKICSLEYLKLAKIHKNEPFDERNPYFRFISPTSIPVAAAASIVNRASPVVEILDVDASVIVDPAADDESMSYEDIEVNLSQSFSQLQSQDQNQDQFRDQDQFPDQDQFQDQSQDPSQNRNSQESFTRNEDFFDDENIPACALDMFGPSDSGDEYTPSESESQSQSQDILVPLCWRSDEKKNISKFCAEADKTAGCIICHVINPEEHDPTYLSFIVLHDLLEYDSIGIINWNSNQYV